MGFVAPLLLGLLVLLSLRQSREPLPGRTWALLRSLLPSWRFFEEVEPGPELRFRIIRGGHAEAWRPVLTPPRERGLLLNAAGNLHLAQQSLVEQLWAELDGESAHLVSQLTSYRLVERLVRERVRELGLATPEARFRFCLASAEGIDFESEEHVP